MGIIHSVYDTDAHFKINAITRAIANGSSSKTTLIQTDHNSERFTFEVPKVVDGHDLSLCNVVEIHYINIDSGDKTKTSADVYEVDDLQISPDDEDVVILSWLISGNATKYAGTLHFLVKFKCVDDAGEVVYVWNTAIYTGISVSSGMNNAAAVVEEHPDIIAQIVERLVALEKGGKGSAARIGYVTLLADGWTGDESLHAQVVEIEGVTANTQVDLTPSVAQLSVFYNKDLTFVTENDNGVVTVYAIGQKPQNDYTIQVTITEVVR